MLGVARAVVMQVLEQLALLLIDVSRHQPQYGHRGSPGLCIVLSHDYFCIRLTWRVRRRNAVGEMTELTRPPTADAPHAPHAPRRVHTCAFRRAPSVVHQS